MIETIIAAVMPLFGELIDRAFPDSEAREKARLEIYAKMQENLNALDLAQMEVNKTEAQHASVFVAGWRPFIGWVCGFAFAYHYILLPFMMFICTAAGRQFSAPEFDMEAMMYVLGGMLGLGTMRSVEKVKGVTAGLSGILPWKK